MIDHAPHAETEPEQDTMSVDKHSDKHDSKANPFQFQSKSPHDLHPEFTSQREYESSGFGYGAAPVPPTFDRFDSYGTLPPYPNGHSHDLPPPPSARTPGAPAINYKYVTPAPAHHRTKSLDHDTPSTSTTKKKRKRAPVEDLDLSARQHHHAHSGPTSAALPHTADIHMADALEATPGLHTGLTGGLSRLLHRHEFPGSPDYPRGAVQDSPLSPMKRAKQADGGFMSEEVRKSRAWRERERDREAGMEEEKAKGKSSRLVRDVAQRRAEREQRKEKEKEKDKDKDKDKERGRSRVTDTIRRITSGSSAQTNATASTGVTADGALVMVRKHKTHLERERRRRSESSDTDSEREHDRERRSRRKQRRAIKENGYDSDGRPTRKLKAIEYHRDRSRSAERDAGAMVLHPHGVAGMGVAQTNGSGDRNGAATGVRKDGEAAQRLTSLFPTASARQEMFLGFVTKGPGSERGCSVNKALKRWHRERYERWYQMGSNGHGSGHGSGHGEEGNGVGREGRTLLSKGDEEKELWRGLRLRKNERGEVVVFF
ncbi:hypothetical protein P152DRAFT_196127 [Eremomyces bilateralis CBS 781.70]|uniref:Uncharacterized protein n=1 Tax=Eremomyces bilateralis CBS 781.70 TaxID=1392243 RepID=A0A6G1GCF3_9PEZI|nr:uncharacterized protein P152DRAFT_196127 [Eremomyces bilateralis CBS 781.70]KAF1815767.1 hypothetical protein P152DRAFT_196127 [Eremomyces bilateralis CBS 781.70]